MNILFIIIFNFAALYSLDNIANEHRSSDEIRRVLTTFCISRLISTLDSKRPPTIIERANLHSIEISYYQKLEAALVREHSERMEEVNGEMREIRQYIVNYRNKQGKLAKVGGILGIPVGIICGDIIFKRWIWPIYKENHLERVKKSEPYKPSYEKAVQSRYNILRIYWDISCGILLGIVLYNSIKEASIEELPLGRIYF